MTPAERQGMWLGLLGVTMFAVTLPVTRLAVGGVATVFVSRKMPVHR